MGFCILFVLFLFHYLLLFQLNERNFHFQSKSNGMRAVCPATVSVLISLLSKWECHVELRAVALKCFAKMLIVLHRSSPVERQIELITVFELYLDVILTLLNTRQFQIRPFEKKFDLSSAQDDDCVDLNALSAVIDNIEFILSEQQSRASICNIIIEANYLPTLASIPKRVQKWEFDTQKLSTSVVRAIAMLRRTVPLAKAVLSNTPQISNLFEGIKSLGKPTKILIEQCIELAYDAEKKEIVFAEIVTHLLDWIKDINESEQLLVTETLLRICTQNLRW